MRLGIFSRLISLKARPDPVILSFFLLSVEDMTKFGVRDVLAPDDYELTDLEPYRRMGKSVEFVRLTNSKSGL